MRYNPGVEIIEIIIRDFSGAKVDSYKFNSSDKELSAKILDVLTRKYGINVKTKSEDKDIDWIQ